VHPDPKTSQEHAEYFFVSDSRGQLDLAVAQSTEKNLWRWFAATALVCGTLAVVLQLRRFPNWQHVLERWPHGFALTGGIAWWWWFDPSAIGLLVIVLVLASLILKRLT